MKILVRLPNWLGDMVMSIGFLTSLKQVYPHARISVIVKKGLHPLLPYFPSTEHQFIFSKGEYKGLTGLIKFGKLIKEKEQFDLFFCLPDSFSSALMGWAAVAKERIGFKNELRNILLTHAYKKPTSLHRVQEYLSLLAYYTKQEINTTEVTLHHTFPKDNSIVVNINSEAQSRRLTVPKAVEIINEVRTETDAPIYLIGAPKETLFVEQVYNKLRDPTGIENKAGQTSFPELIELLACAQVMLTTDSGPAHVANALGTQTIVLFGAGNETNTSPYNKDWNTVIRLGKLSCEPCTKNVCVKYDTPQCLVQLSTDKIVQTVKQKIDTHEA